MAPAPVSALAARVPGSRPDRIVLRPFALSDAEALVQASLDPDVAALPGPSLATVDEARAWIERAERDRQGEGPWRFAVADAEGGELLGYTGVRLVDGNGQIGYWVRREARGRGVATEALRLLVRWAFEERSFGRLQLLTEPDNRASQRVAEKCGFRREGLLRSYVVTGEHRVDGVMFGLLPGDRG